MGKFDSGRQFKKYIYRRALRDDIFFSGGWIVFFPNWWGLESHFFKTYRRNYLAVKYSFSNLVGVVVVPFQESNPQTFLLGVRATRILTLGVWGVGFQKSTLT